MIRVFNKFEPIPSNFVEVDTTSHGSFKDLSPFYLGPINLTINEDEPMHCLRFENLWQYSKVYREHATLKPGLADFGFMYEPTKEFFQWRALGFSKSRAVRYPMGKGIKPLYSYWKGAHLNYIDARYQIYIPVYRELVLRTKSYAMLYNWVLQGRDIALRDFDGYDHASRGMTLRDVINNPKKSMGHAFVIYGLLTGELQEIVK
jgi:hypothetical protein